MLGQMTAAEARDAFADAVALWAGGIQPPLAVVRAACDALVAGLDSPGLRTVAALPGTATDVEVKDVIRPALEEFGIPFDVRNFGGGDGGAAPSAPDVMVVTCTSNRADVLGDHQRGRATRPEAEYDLTVGHQYQVVGMLLWETTLLFVVRSDSGAPYTAPVGLFDRSSSRLPADWSFAIGPGVALSGPRLWQRPLVATWGYRELVDDEGHLERLVEGDPHAAAVFSRQLAADL